MGRELQIIRKKHQDKQTLGSMLVLDGHETVFECKTLELPWKDNQRRVSCIPTGRYAVKKRWSKKFKHHFHIQGVDGRDWILIHSGNYHTQILGCVLVGASHVDINNDGYKDVTSSGKTMKKLLDVMPNEFYLEII